jgi:hypothetical protein
MKPDPLYDRRNNFRVPLVPVKFKVGTMSSSTWLVRKRDLPLLKVGGQILIFSERWAQGVPVLIDEVRSTGMGELWIVQRF